MKTNLFIIFLLIFSSSLANEEEEKNEVWVDGASFYQSIPHKKKSTIYFKEWSPYAQQFLLDDSYFVAIQLDERFDPLPDDRMEAPNLTSLAAIASDTVLEKYLIFLEQFGRTQGINYLILPDTAGLSDLEKSVLKKASLQSPYYFLEKSYLSYSVPESRKDFEIESTNHPTIWITTQDENLGKIQRWSSKYLGKEQFDFFTSLRKARDSHFIPNYELSENLKRELFDQAVIAIDPESILPLTDSYITYLGNDLSLRRWLSHYAHVLDYRVDGIRTIVDIRNTDQEIREEDILLTRRLLIDEKIASQLIAPVSIDLESFVFSKMLFGSQAILGKHKLGRTIYNYKFLGYSTPYLEGMNATHLEAIDTLARHAITHFATPGMQVAVVKNGNLVWENNYGYQTYDSLIPVKSETLYDVASLTKVMATLPAIALLMDRGLLTLEDSVSQHLPEFVGSNKSGISVRKLLAHNAGLRSYIPFWSMMLDGDRLDPFYYKTTEDEALDRRSYGFEPHPILLDTLKSFIVKSELIKNQDNYNYSDLGFMVLHLIVESVSGMDFEDFLAKEFYKPMGLTHTTFNPLSNGFKIEEIAPTEYDQRYRNYQVRGEVHDRNALVFGGAAGHAGLFSNATDMAKMTIMLLNEGYYGGRRYLSSEVLNQFNLRYFEKNRRGLGWDKKDGVKDSASKYASDKSFGHTGFTGTMVWADPEQDLIFVFLSNRIYPDAENWRLGQLNTRTHIHDVIYESIKSED